jgi:LysM repeat protein
MHFSSKININYLNTMNTQPKKILTISAVVLLHVAVITLMLAQHGCKSDGAKASAPAAAAPAPVAADNNFVAPTRPAPVVPVVPIPVGQFSEPLASEPLPAAPIPTPTPASSAPPVTWVVANGDTLSSIAKKNGITVSELVAANAPKVKITTPLKIGQTLIVPNKGASTQPATAAAENTPPGGSVYTVQTGDSLSKIAVKNGTTIAAIKSLNKLTSNTVRVGQKLDLPAASAKPSAASNASSTPASVDTSSGEYTVEAGDTLSKIAVKTGVKLKDLMSVNNLTEAAARNLHPGQKLQLPSNAHVPDTFAPATPAEVTPIPSLPTTLGAPSNVTGVPAPTATTAPITPVQ